jgi:hypothetical protein
MKDNLIDFESVKNKKIKQQMEDEMKKFKEDELNKNTELFKEITGKNMLFLNDEELRAYQEVGVLCTFNLKDTYSMCIAVFREQMYVINHVGGKFEFIGKLEDVISKGIFGE